MSRAIVAEVIKNIKLSKPIDQIIPLQIGRSQDEKYILAEKTKNKYVLRLADIKIYDRRKTEFEIINNFYQDGIRCLKPVSFGITPNGSYCYSIFKYVDGKSGSEILPSLSKKDQYQIGIAIGAELKKMHQLKCPIPAVDWYEKRSQQFFTDLEEFRRLNLSFDKEGYVQDYIKANLDLMKGRPSTFQHNDYGAGNLIIKNKEFKAVIDFNAFDWGDPICDFFQVPWVNKRYGLPFARGQIIGYCGGKVTKEFWELYNLYVMMIVYYRLVSIYKNETPKYESKLRQVNKIVKEHDLIRNAAPVWFK